MEGSVRKLLATSGVRRAAFGALCLALSAFAAAPARALDHVRLGTNWLAEAEHGGFYQAAADGTYAKYGLDVTIAPGGPQANNELLLPVGKLDFYIGGNLLTPFNAAAQNVPIVAVAAMFQKDPQIFMSHPHEGLDTFQSLRDHTIFVGKEGLATFYRWMKADWGFRGRDVKPYTYNAAPFIADKKSAMEGYVTSEPYSVEKLGGFKPNVFLLYDYGFTAYSTLVLTRPDLIAKRPGLVQRFVDASAIGWYHYLYGNNAAANKAILKANPEMTQGQIDYSIAKMRQDGIVDSGLSLKDGIGAMHMRRIASFFAKMAHAGVVKKNVDFKKAFDLQFVDKKIGLDLRPKN